MNERLAVFWHADALAFDTGAGVFEAPPSPLLDTQMPHPEGPERIRNIRSVLQRGPVADRLDWHDGRLATRDEVLRFHGAAAKRSETEITVHQSERACRRGNPSFAYAVSISA